MRAKGDGEIEIRNPENGVGDYGRSVPSERSVLGFWFSAFDGFGDDFYSFGQ